MYLCQAGHANFMNHNNANKCIYCEAPFVWQGPYTTEIEMIPDEESATEVFSESEVKNGSKARFFSSERYKIPD